jgi:hypothetical protein
MAVATQTLARLKITTQSGETHEIEAPLDLMASEFVEELRQALQLPATNADNRAIVWQLDNKNTGNRLDGEKTLEENGVRDGHELRLWRVVIAGGR